MQRFLRFRRPVARDDRQQQLFDELARVRDDLAGAYRRFDQTSEPELVEACVYEVAAAQARYNFLLRAIKDAGGKAAFLACAGEEGAAWA